MNTYNKIIRSFLLVLVLFIYKHSDAQVDRTFWFVAPEVTHQHRDDAIMLRITALDKAANVKISIPANPAFTPITSSISANNQVKIELDNWKNLIENGAINPGYNDWSGWTPGTPFKKGILIESDVDITAYYEVANSNNPDRFTLKGNNALGREFYIPSQNTYQNHRYDNEPYAREKIDIVATEDNTKVTFTLTENVKGHTKGVEHTITLNRGETYCLRREEGDEKKHLGGSHITSDKPIAITISDDSIETRGQGHYDLVGDQIVPTNVIGNKYVVVNTMFEITNYQNTGQKVFVVATKDNTSVMVNGTTIATLDAGEMHGFDISNKNFDYIESNHNIYVYQLSGVGYELGSALVPSIECTGSTSVSISKIYDNLFSVQIMTQKSNINNFTLSSTRANSTVSLSNLKWNWIEDSGPENDDDTWYAAVANLTNASTSEILTIANSGLFHLSVLDANGASMSYGYFSSFNNLKIDGPSIACIGEDVVLSTTQDPTNLTWYYKEFETDEKEVIGSAVSEVIAEKEGQYWVELNFPGCLATDKIDVEYNKPNFTLGGELEICYDNANPEITLVAETTPPDAVYEYQWGAPYESNTTNTLTFTPEPGKEYNFSLTAWTTDELRCEFSETADITVKSIPQVIWNVGTGDNIEICEGDIVALDNTLDDFTYQWYLDGVAIPGETTPNIEPTTSGLYEVEITTEEECTVIEGKTITVNPNPSVNLDDAAECPGTPYTYSLSGYASYLWHDGSTSPSITLYNAEPEVSVTVTDPKGCKATATAEFIVYNEHVFHFGSDTTVCTGNDITIEIDDMFVDYKWTFNGVEIPSVGDNPTANNHVLHFQATDAAIHNGEYFIEAKDNVNSCDVNGSFNLEVLPAVEFKLVYDERGGKICDGDSIKLEAIVDNGREFTTFEWFYDDGSGSGWEEYLDNSGNPVNEPFLIVYDEGSYRLDASQNNGCAATSQSLGVQVNESPRFFLDGSEVCPGEELTLRAYDYLNSSGNIPEGLFDKLVLWNFEGENNIESTEMPSTFVVDKEGNYIVTAYDQLGCFETKSIFVGYHDVPVVNIDDEDEFCDGDGYDLSLLMAGYSEDTYYWTLDGEKVNNTIFESGEYKLHIVTDDNCDIEIASINLTALESPAPYLASEAIVCEDTEISIETDKSYRTYQWLFNNVDIAGETTNAITPTESGIYTVVVTAKNGCQARVSTDVTYNTNPVVTLGPDQTLCAGETALVSISGDYNKVIWSTGVEDELSVKLNIGTHAVRVIDEYGCSATDNITIDWHPIQEFSLGEDLIICPVDLPIEISVIGPSFEEYIWHDDAILLAQDRIYGNVMDTVNIVKVRDSNNCWYMDTQIINFFSEPDYDFGGDFGECEAGIELIAGDEFTIEQSDGNVEVTKVQTYKWLHNNADTPNIFVDESGEYIVQAFDGCWFKTDTFNVELYDNPEIVGLDTIYYERVIVLTNPERGTAPFIYSLNDGIEQESNQFDKVKNGEHIIWVEDANGCTAHTVFTLDSNLDDFKVPNIFTPNGDGYNDTWVIKGLEKLPDSEIRVFDRYGKLLVKYKASDEPWDGTYLNKPVPSDDYWYVIQLNPIDKIVKGNVTIKR